MSRILRNHFRIAIILLAIAFSIRLYAASVVPLTHDEDDIKHVAEKISFEPQKLNMPIGDELIKHPLLQVYIYKVSTVLFGMTRLGGRFLFILISILSLYFVYRLVEGIAGKKQGLLTLTFLTFSQFHISITRLAEHDGVLLFFVSIITYTFFKAIYNNRQRWIYLTGLALGVAYLGKAAIILLIPALFIFLVTEARYRYLLRRKETYIAFFLGVFIALPHLVMFYKHTYEDVTKIGLSLRFFYFYLGEMFVWLAGKTSLFLWDFSCGEPSIFFYPANTRIFISHISPELPLVNWLMGVLVFSSVFYFLLNNKKNNDLIKFSLIIFCIVLIITTLLSTQRSLLDEHWWADTTIFFGFFILASALINLAAKHKMINLIIIGLIVYFAINAFSFLCKTDNVYAVPQVWQAKYTQKHYG